MCIRSTYHTAWHAACMRELACFPHARARLVPRPSSSSLSLQDSDQRRLTYAMNISSPSFLPPRPSLPHPLNTPPSYPINAPFRQRHSAGRKRFIHCFIHHSEHHREITPSHPLLTLFLTPCSTLYCTSAQQSRIEHKLLQHVRGETACRINGLQKACVRAYMLCYMYTMCWGLPL